MPFQMWLEVQTIESKGCRIVESLCVPAFIRVLPANISGKTCTRNVAQVLIFGGAGEGTAGEGEAIIPRILKR